MDDGRPALADGAVVNWAVVDTARVSFLASENYALLAGASGDGPPAELARRSALVSYYGRGDNDAARAAWATQIEPARDPAEAAMVADLAAQAGAADARAAIERLRVFQQGEADAILADALVRQGNIDGATTALESAFQAFRTTPWAGFRYKLKALTLANTIAKVSPDAARRLFNALKEPFSVRAMEVDRLTTAAALARAVDFKGLCQPVVAATEPHVPWDFRFLSQRRDCYLLVGDARLAVATRELEEYLSKEPLALASGLGGGQQ